MTIQLSQSERTLLLDSLRRLLQDSWPVEGAAEMANDPAALRRLSLELCRLGLADLGATNGPGLSEALLAFEELGRVSCPVPLMGVMLANRLLEASDSPAADLFLAAMRNGEAVPPAVGLAGVDGDRMAGRVELASGQLLGAVAFVEGIAASGHLLVLVSAPHGVSVVALDSTGVSVTVNPGLAVPALSTVTLNCAPSVWQACSANVLTDSVQEVRLLTAARALGAAQRVFDLALDHAKVRRQFGHVIGEFQAVQHKLVDCFCRLDGARLSLAAAAEARDRGEDAWRVFADAALAFTGPALRQLSLEAHHTLGAIGYAEEHEAPRHFRRIHADLARFGGAARARAALADYLLLSD